MSKIYLIVSTIFCISFAIAYVAVKKQLQDTQDLLAETFEANYLLTEQIISNNKTDTDSHNESFIKYLSDSREWAFSYIETTQAALIDIISELNKRGINDMSDKLTKLLPEIDVDEK
jgi:hypothetical protein